MARDRVDIAVERERKRVWSRRQSLMDREIGLPPECANPERRDACLADPVRMLTTYFGASFPLAFSRDHLEVIETIERVTIDGGLFALAMPRGAGKTTIVIRMVIRAILTGRRRFVSVIASTDLAARKIIRAIKSELTFNEML